MRSTTLWAVAQLAVLASASRWKQVLYDYNFPSSSGAADHLPYHVQTDPKAYGIVHEEAKNWKNLGAKRVQIKYGPFKVPSMMDQNGMIDYLQVGTPMPCKDCMITYMHAGLEYPDGSYANANTSLWLHHVVFIDASTPDTVCGSNYYAAGQRWFASGNERTPMAVSVAGKIPTGYYVAPNSYNVMLVELMNTEMKEQQAVLTVTYEYVPKKPKGWFNARPFWLDIAGCFIRSDMPPKTNTTFTYTMNPTYTSKYQGALIGQGGHIHDGGVNIKAYRNNNVMCNCKATYATSGGYVSPPGPMMGMSHCKHMSSDEDMKSMSMPMKHTTMKTMKHTSTMKSMPKPTGLTWCGGNPKLNHEHIDHMSTCYAPDGMIMKGDVLKNEAWYDFNTHAPMLNNDGTIMDIMGISLIYIAENMSMKEMMHYIHSG